MCLIKTIRKNNFAFFYRKGEEITYKPKPKKRKVVPRALDGTYFEIVSNDEGKIEAKCKICDGVKKGNLKSTGNFINHYKTRHQEVYFDFESHLKEGNIRYDSNKTQQPKSTHFQPLTAQEVVVKLTDFRFSKVIIPINSRFRINYWISLLRLIRRLTS